MAGFTTRPVVMGRRGVVAAGHYLAATAGLRIIEHGGNAIDAAAAMCFCLNLLEPHLCGIGGEVPVLIYSAKAHRPIAISGMGWAPERFTIGWCQQHGIDLIPGDGYLPACVPAVVGTWAAALASFGTMTFSQVLEPAIELAREGFPVYQGLREAIIANMQRFTERYPTTADIYCPGGYVPQVGELMRNPDWANVLETLCQAEQRAAGRDRTRGIEAARDVFYQGEIAERIVDFTTSHPVLDASGAEHTALLSHSDMAEWRASLEEPVTFTYRGLDVHKCSSWTQGPVFLQQLAILQGYDLRALGHNSADYLHTWVECAKLAFADREAYYGDPAFDEVPFAVLLSEEYAARRRELISPRASLELRPGTAGDRTPDFVTFDIGEDNRRALERSTFIGDTTQLVAADREGNMVSATPSGGWISSSPVVAGLGFPLGTRGQMFYLNARRPNALAPHKRPRATLTPSLVTKEGEPYLAFGTPGGDCQDQWTLQFFLNYVDFGMGLQEALDAPTVHSEHFPSSFYPRTAHPGRVVAEGRIPAEVIAQLEQRGHEVVVTGDWVNGRVMAAQFDQEHGVVMGGVSPRGQVGYALAW